MGPKVRELMRNFSNYVEFVVGTAKRWGEEEVLR